VVTIDELNTERPTLVHTFWLSRNLSNHMDRQTRTCDTVLVKNRELTGRSQTLPWWVEGGGVKTTEKQNTLASLEAILCAIQQMSLSASSARFFDTKVTNYLNIKKSFTLR
jgi:hypothetical protein